MRVFLIFKPRLARSYFSLGVTVHHIASHNVTVFHKASQYFMKPHGTSDSITVVHISHSVSHSITIRDVVKYLI